MKIIRKVLSILVAIACLSSVFSLQRRRKSSTRAKGNKQLDENCSFKLLDSLSECGTLARYEPGWNSRKPGSGAHYRKSVLTCDWNRTGKCKIRNGSYCESNEECRCGHVCANRRLGGSTMSYRICLLSLTATNRQCNY